MFWEKEKGVLCCMKDPSCVIGLGHTYFLFVNSQISSKEQQENLTLGTLFTPLHSFLACMKRHKLLDCSEITKFSVLLGVNSKTFLWTSEPHSQEDHSAGASCILLHLSRCQLAGWSSHCCLGAPCPQTSATALGECSWREAHPKLHFPLFHCRFRYGCQKSLLPPLISFCN